MTCRGLERYPAGVDRRQPAGLLEHHPEIVVVADVEGKETLLPLFYFVRSLAGHTVVPHHPGPLLPSPPTPSPGEEGDKQDRSNRDPLSQ
jgi:hypothetical protein